MIRFAWESPPDSAFSGHALGMNNNGTGLVLASVALADHPQVLLPIIFYNLVQHLVASIVDLALFKSRSPKPPLPASV
jgi:BASS family bile acid:Na+ symporter